jgi:hypothetical protein
MTEQKDSVLLLLATPPPVFLYVLEIRLKTVVLRAVASRFALECKRLFGGIFPVVSAELASGLTNEHFRILFRLSNTPLTNLFHTAILPR